MAAADDGDRVRSVERALTLLALIDQHGELGLEELHYLTGLPKPTVSRLLRTLVEQGWLFRGLADRRYRPARTRTPVDARRRYVHGVVERAAPWLIELGERSGCTADLALFDDAGLGIVESYAPAALRPLYPPRLPLVGLRSSLLHSAMGKACLGGLDDAAFAALLARLGVDPGQAGPVREQVRREGYGARTEGHWEYPMQPPFAIRALALPLHLGAATIGAVALHWPSAQASVDAVAEAHLEALARAVAGLRQALDEQP